MSDQEFADEFSRFCSANCTRSNSPVLEDTLKRISRDHRTCQQNMTRFCVSFLEMMANQGSDARNEASVKLAKEFVENIEPNNRILPYV